MMTGSSCLQTSHDTSMTAGNVLHICLDMWPKLWMNESHAPANSTLANTTLRQQNKQVILLPLQQADANPPQGIDLLLDQLQQTDANPPQGIDLLLDQLQQTDANPPQGIDLLLDQLQQTDANP